MSHSPSKSRLFTIAVVDDDLRIVESLADLLESAGYRVRGFCSGQALLDNDAFAAIECVITDIGMPGIDGFELQRLARVRRPGLPIILITGRHEIADQQRALSVVNHGFFRKPFDAKVLLAAVSRAVSCAGTQG